MDRTIYWSQNQSRTFDLVEGDHDALVAFGDMLKDILGSTTTVVTGFGATAASPNSFSFALAAGRIYQQADADATSVGAIPQDTTIITQQGNYAGGTITLSTSGLSIGQSQWALVEAQFSQVDAIRANDPNGGLLYFYNAANPQQPFQGPNNSGQTTDTVRKGTAVVQVVMGTPATTGSEVPPNATSGWVPLYLVDLAYGQTAISQAEILVAGPSVGTGVPSNYSAAPFLAGMLNSHHGGVPGQAPKIKLGSEVQGTLGFGNLPEIATDSSNTANTVILAFTPAITQYTDGLIIRFKVANANTGACTIAVNGLAAIPLVSPAGALQGGEVVANAQYAAIYSAATNSAVIVESGAGALAVNPGLKSQHAVNLGQAETTFAALNGSNSQSFNVGGYGLFLTSHDGLYSSNIFCDAQDAGTANDLVFRTGASDAQKYTYVTSDGRLTLAAQATGTYDALPLGQGETLFNPGRLLNVRAFTSSGTYTPSSGTNKIKVRIWGGGGGGGGSVASSSSGGSGGSGGTGGAYAEGIFSVSGSLQATVGVGGAGGQGDNYGSAGGASSLGTLITAGGGAYGLSAAAGIPAPGATSVPSASGGYFLFSPGASADAFPLGRSTNGFFGSTGTASFGSSPSNMSVTNGFFGVFPGGGGGGAGSYVASGSTANGGTGANGLIIIEEYS